MEQFSRRQFLKTSGIAALGAGLPSISMGARKRPLQADVVIVGAGIAGLGAAHDLWKAGLNSFLVLDADDHVGGRIEDMQLGAGLIVEGGAEWIGPTHTEMLALIRELGLSTFKTYDTGRGLLALGHHVITPNGAADAEIAAAKAVIDEMALAIPLDTPWLAPNAAALDSVSLGAWLRSQGYSADIQLLFDKVTWAILGGLAKDISLLYFLFYIHSGGGIEERIGVSGAAQDSRILNGPQQVPIRLADKFGGRVVLNNPVRKIAQTGQGVQVSSDRLTVDAKRVIVAMMPADAARIVFEPRMPPRRQGLVSQWVGASDLKADVLYREPFWRRQGLSGQVSCVGTIYSVFDNSPPDASRGVLEIFAKSGQLPAARGDRVKTILATLAAYFGTGALKAIGYAEKDWADEAWVSGCVSPLPPGFLTAFGPALRQPVGRIHWAGAETADVWNGKMEGALRSGKRAAAEVLAQLQRSG